MSMTTIALRHDGTCGADPAICEVILLGVERPGGSPPLFPPPALPEGWEEMADVDIGNGGQRVPSALRGTAGSLSIPYIPGDRLLLLSHPWSGRVVLEVAGHPPLPLSLGAQETTVLSVDPRGGEPRACDPATVLASRFAPEQEAPPAVEALRVPALDRPPSGHVRLRATGQKSLRALGSEVILLRVEPRGFGRAMDLAPAAERAGWESIDEISGQSGHWRGVAKGWAGALLVRVGPGGRLLMLRHPWSGIVEISHEETTLRIDLYSAETRTLEIDLAQLPALADALAEHAMPEPRGDGDAALAAAAGPPLQETVQTDATHAPTDVARVAHSERSAHYQHLLARIDPSEPVALYVPRWRGVALSTQMLFRQSLPVPPGLDEHPDEISPEDIESLAEVLVESGARHFVVSGGDLFNLAILRAVLARAPDRRFDLLWHSNFLQMGEPHDWNLLRHWLQALRDGEVTRVGVVKAGLERWFAALDVDAVHIPNIVPLPARTEGAAPAGRRQWGAGEGPLLGVWLSGSSPYRKTPLAVLAATTMIPGARLRAAGLDETARRFVSDAQVPFERLWSRPLPREMLHRQMRDTDLTLYVTLSECSPMVPLESFALGVPCLIGPASDLFRDHEALREKIVVERPLAPAAIAEKAIAAIAARDEILADYGEYHAALSARSRQQVAALVA